MKTTLLLEILKEFPNPIFVETGTGDGGAVQLALGLKNPDNKVFERIITMDVVKDNIDKLGIHPDLVCGYVGDSRNILRGLLKDIKEPITFWLDAHGHYKGQKRETCLAEELMAIADFWIPESIVLIDDFEYLYEKVWDNSLMVVSAFGNLIIRRKLQVEYRKNSLGGVICILGEQITKYGVCV